MNCTSCKQGILKPSSIEGNLPAHSCTHCNGNWILIEDFISWSKSNPNQELTNGDAYTSDVSDSKKALVCPETGAIMSKYHISNSLKHRLDYSAAAGGVWLDEGEWELLKAEGLAGSLNSLVTAEWQNELKNNKTRNNFENLYKTKFGDDSYTKIKEIKTWLESHSEQADLKAYLLAKDPYSANR